MAAGGTSHERYALRIFESKSFQKYAQSFGAGILEHRAAIGWDDLKNIKIGIPPLNEQQRLLDHLDQETNRIDKLINKKSIFMVLLREKRRAFITNAVTKGLDTKVKMKNSGVPWLGEIPSHWNITPIKYITTVNDEERNINEPQPEIMHYVEISSVTLEDGIKQPSEILTKDAPSRAQRKARAGDVILSTVRTYLRAIGIVKEEHAKCIFSTGFAVIRPTAKIESDFLYYSILSEPFLSEIEANSKGISYPAINASEVMQLKIATPPSKEQIHISQIISQETKRIDCLIKQTENSITLLNERRSRLITAAVTGELRTQDKQDA